MHALQLPALSVGGTAITRGPTANAFLTCLLCRWTVDLRFPRVRGARQRVHPRVRALLRVLPVRGIVRALSMPCCSRRSLLCEQIPIPHLLVPGLVVGLLPDCRVRRVLVLHRVAALWGASRHNGFAVTPGIACHCLPHVSACKLHAYHAEAGLERLI